MPFYIPGATVRHMADSIFPGVAVCYSRKGANMRIRLSIYTLFRTPVRTALSIVLLGVVTFALFSQATEYAITQRELNKAASKYFGLGTVEITPPSAPPNADAHYPSHLTLENTSTNHYKLLTQDLISAISELPYISSTDIRYMTAGVSDRYFRLDDGDYIMDFTARCVIEATVITEKETIDDGGGNIFASFYVGDATILAGNLPLAVISNNIDTEPNSSALLFHGYMRAGIPFGIQGIGYEGLINKNRALNISIAQEGHDPERAYGSNYIKDLEMGKRYVFVLRFGLLEPPGGYYFDVGDYLSEPWCDAIWPLDGEPDNYLETEKFTPLRDLIEITEQDCRTFDIVYTEDMDSIMRFADNRMEVTEGRMLTREDSIDGSDALNTPTACVVSTEFASENDLKIGDRISMRLGNRYFEQYINLGAIAGTPERFMPPSINAELEIIGIYKNNDSNRSRSKDPHWSYSVNTIFVPKTLLPVSEIKLEDYEYNSENRYRVDSKYEERSYSDSFRVDNSALTSHGFAPSEFSFRIDDPRHIKTFMDEAGPLIWDMGLTLILNDGGWRYVEQGFMEVGRISVIKLMLFTAAVIAATCFTVYLFIGRRKKDYVIMRALGTSKLKAGKTLAIPLIASEAISVLIGSSAAYAYTMSTIARNNAFVAIEKYAVDTSIPAAVVICSALGHLLLTFAITLIILRRISFYQPLALLQGGDTMRPQKLRMRSGKLKVNSIST